MYTDNIKLIQDQREILIKARTIEENKMADFAKAVHSVDINEVFDGIYVPPVLTLEAFCPEAYKDIPDPDKYQEEFENMVKILEPINQRMIEINQQAAEAIAQFRQMS